MKTKTIIATLVLLLLIPVGGFVWWINFPKVSHPSVISQAYTRAETHFAKRLKVANSPENGFKHAVMRAYWTDPYSGTPLADAIENWDVLAETKAWPQEQNDVEGSEEVTQLRVLFESHLPDILQSVNSPAFSYDLSPKRWGHTIKSVNFDSIAVGLAFYAHIEMVEGRKEQGLDHLKSVLHLASSLDRQQEYLHSEGARDCRKAFRRFVLQQLADDRLTAEDWSRLAEMCWQHLPPKDIYDRCQDDALLQTLQRLEEVKTGKASVQSMMGNDLKWRIPGVIEREERIYKNQMVYYYKRNLAARPNPTWGTWESLYLWTKGDFTQLAVPASIQEYAFNQAYLERVQMEAFGLLCAAKAKADGLGESKAFSPSSEGLSTYWSYDPEQETWEHPMSAYMVLAWEQDTPVDQEAGFAKLVNKNKVIYSLKSSKAP